MAWSMLFGEAPVREDGFAFSHEAQKTEIIAGAIGVDPQSIYRFFFVANVFDASRPRASYGRYDEFNDERAVEQIVSRYLEHRNIICVGTRVGNAMARARGHDIPYAEFGWVRWRNAGDRRTGWIYHPSGGYFGSDCAAFLRRTGWGDRHYR